MGSCRLHTPDICCTPPKSNMEPENYGFQKGSPFPGTDFQVENAQLRRCMVYWHTDIYTCCSILGSGAASILVEGLGWLRALELQQWPRQPAGVKLAAASADAGGRLPGMGEDRDGRCLQKELRCDVLSLE